MEVLLSTIHANRLFIPLALLYLKAVLLGERGLKAKLDVELKEFDNSVNDDFILYEIKRYKPEIVGFSCYVWNIRRILALSWKLKKLNSNIKIILGGPQVSPLAKTLLAENSQIDIVVRDEGERTFQEVVRQLLNSDGSISGVSGITYRRNTKIVENAARKTISDLDSIPSPYLDNFINLEKKRPVLKLKEAAYLNAIFVIIIKALLISDSLAWKELRVNYLFYSSRNRKVFI